VSFVDALPESELWIGELRPVRLSCGRVLLVRTEAGVFAYEDRCPHLGLPLSSGTLEGDTLTISGSGDSFSVGTQKAAVVCGNVPTANATVYLISSVLMPKM